MFNISLISVFNISKLCSNFSEKPYHYCYIIIALGFLKVLINANDLFKEIPAKKLKKNLKIFFRIIFFLAKVKT